MQRNNTASRSVTPTQNHSPTLPDTAITKTTGLIAKSPRAFVQRHRKTAIVITGAIVLIALFRIAPTLATALVFACLLFGINTLIDSRMAGGDQ